jgi:hypothetical protein
MRHGGHAAPARTDMPGGLEKDVSLKGHAGVALVRAAPLQRDELSLDERLDIGAVQIIGFSTVVDEKQDGKFMGTQHSWLQRVHWSGAVRATVGLVH